MPQKKSFKKRRGGDDSQPADSTIPQYAFDNQDLYNRLNSDVAATQVAGKRGKRTTKKRGGSDDNILEDFSNVSKKLNNPTVGGSDLKTKGGYSLAPFITALTLLGSKLLSDKKLRNELKLDGLFKNKKGGEPSQIYYPQHNASGGKPKSKNNRRRKGGDPDSMQPLIANVSDAPASVPPPPQPLPPTPAPPAHVSAPPSVPASAPPPAHPTETSGGARKKKASSKKNKKH